MGCVIWLTGLSGSGKTTIAERVLKVFRTQGKRVELLDGDMVRGFFEGDLGYTREERIMNVKRIVFTAMFLAKNEIDVIVANIAPYYESRDFVRKHLKNYIQVYLNAPLDILRKRDVKGHYALYDMGKIRNLIGVDDVYETPRNPDLVLMTNIETVEESVGRTLNLLKEKGILSI